MNDALSNETRNAGRILFIAEAFGGGMFEITRMQAEGLARIGYQVGIGFGVRPETPTDARSAIDDSVELFPLPWTSRSIVAQIRAQRALRALISAWQPDLIHLMSSFAGLHGVFAAGNHPTIYTPQAYAFTMDSAPAWKRWAYLGLESIVADRVSVIGACSLSEGEQARSIPTSHNVAVVPNGIDELSAGGHAVTREVEAEFRVVAIGRPLPQRRPEACARILSAVSDVAEVRWLGGGRDDSLGTRTLIEAGVPMSGWLPRSETMKILADSMVYLHWTGWDGLPLSVLEALALDVIVVASDIGPNREVLGPDQVCRSEVEAIKLIRSIVSEPELRAQLREEQRRRRKAYGADKMVERWGSLYSSVLDAGSCRPDDRMRQKDR